MIATDGTQYDPTHRQLNCRGHWTLHHLPTLEVLLAQVAWPTSGAVKIDGHGIETMDSAGAWLLCTWQKKLEDAGIKIRLLRFSKEAETLLGLVQARLKEETALPALPIPPALAKIGRSALASLGEFNDYLVFVGKLSVEALRIIPKPSSWRIGAIVSTIYRTGYQALPIIALLSLMIGVVITYQMGLQLKNYGANIFIVDLLGLSILREFGPLITAIMVAGRTGSAFTAQLGMMKLNQEIDALDTLGVTPGEILLLPRIIGLFISLPLITMWADMFGVFGGMIMSSTQLSITWYDFLHRFPQVIPLRALLIGLGKAPIFALVIASIGCYQGVKVEGSADSVGVNTTRSVVLAIFFIIVADAIFSVIFSRLKL